ncbi:unnamed protein product [Paramecium pentaurelia]|uniref:Uncharacterized protein n=1 Tax=Paramecium pentaurelia TaxID=43138 RepID=A0A8S1SNX7_9CILI|nr:unnamed protein product [Paramecium pentaurelia]
MFQNLITTILQQLHLDIKNIKIWKFKDGQMIDQIQSLIQKQGFFLEQPNGKALNHQNSFNHQYYACIQIKMKMNEYLEVEIKLQKYGKWIVNQLKLNSNISFRSIKIMLIKQSQILIQMVSCGWDSQIILGKKDCSMAQQFKYIFQQSIQDIGMSIRFLEDDTIVWCQFNQPFLQVFKLQNRTFQERFDLKVQLKELIIEMTFSTLICFSYNIYQKQKFLFQVNQKCILYERILNQFFFAILLIYNQCCRNITDDGRYLVNWNKKQKQLQIYKIQYERKLQLYLFLKTLICFYN